MGQCRSKRQRHGVTVLLGGLAALGLNLFALSASAGQLQFWHYSSAQNRLEFATDEVVRPRVQIIPNPVRLVVDLPGVKLNQPTTTQTYSAAVRSVRVGQFDAQTARIVVEIAAGYTVDPNQVKVSGLTSSSWAVDLPSPIALPPSASGMSSDAEAASPGVSIATTASPRTTSTPPRSSSSLAQAASPVAVTGLNTLEDILVTPDGLFLKTSEVVKRAQIRRNGSEVSVNLTGVTVPATLSRNPYKLNYHGIHQLSVRQTGTQPLTAQLTLQVDRNSPNWLATVSRFGGVVLLPRNGSATVNRQRPTESLSLLQAQASSSASRKPSSSSLGSVNSQSALVQNIALGGSQLLIQSNHPVVYTSGWEGAQYRVTVLNAQPSQSLRTPQTAAGSALSTIALRQDGKNLSILVTPAPGVRISTISRIGTQTAVLGLVRAGSSPVFSQQPSSTLSQSPGLSQLTLPTPVGRRIVVIDPGHGNIDPGAIGIGGLKETDVVLAIGLEVARLLQQQGVQVYLTRVDESKDVDLPPRVALAEKVRANLFVSIHANSINLSRPDVNGVETYYAPGSAAGAELAQTILNSITRSVNIQSRGIHSARFYVIRNTSMPSTLIETGFVTGGDDAPKLGDPNFQRQMAAAIARGVIEYLNLH